MRVVITLPQRCDGTPDGGIWVKSDHAYDYWVRFLDVFDEVNLVSRVRNVISVPDGMHRVNGEGVTVTPVPNYVGAWDYLKQARKVRLASQSAFNQGDAVILFGDQGSSAIEKLLRPIGYPYAMYLRGDPYDVYAPGAMKHPLRPYLRWQGPIEIGRLCANACAAEYVTEHALQRRYPCPGYSVGISEVELSEKSFAATPRAPQPDKKSFNIVMVGTLAQLYKAPNILIDAVAICIREGLDLNLAFIGDGRHRPELEAQANAQGIADRVTFKGELPSGEAVRAELDRSDLFVLPSYQEGLPRAMVEAMSRALPCIGSTVGGFSELLAEEDLVSPGDRKALASKIREVLLDPQRMARMSARNLDRSKYYREDLHRKRWTDFCRYLKERTEEWLVNTAK